MHLVFICLSDPPIVSDFREALELSRSNYKSLDIIVAGNDYTSKVFSSFARTTMALMTLHHIAPQSFANSSILHAPHPDDCTISTHIQLEKLGKLYTLYQTNQDEICLCLGRGVLSWLMKDETKIQSWKSALGFTRICTLGRTDPETLIQAHAICHVEEFNTLALHAGISFGSENDFGDIEKASALRWMTYVAPPVLGFLTRHALIPDFNTEAWWKPQFPDCWSISSKLTVDEVNFQGQTTNDLLLQAKKRTDYELDQEANGVSIYSKTVACIGGSFNPPTNAHMAMAIQVLSYGAADEVWFIPCGKRQDKPELQSCYVRTCMTALAVESSLPFSAMAANKVRVLGLEFYEKEALPSIELFTRLEHSMPNIKFSLVVGMDCLQSLKHWNSPLLLKEKVHFIAITRPGYGYEKEDLEDLPRNLTQLEPEACQSISSSEVRRRLRNSGKPYAEKAFSVDGLVSGSVANIISNLHLY